MIKLAMFVEGLDVPEEVIGLNSEKIERAAYRAINSTADRARKLSADEIRRRVNFPASYLNPQERRLYVSNKAGPGDLEAMILGRHRPTSLARFVTRGAPGKTGVDVEVTPGKSDEMKRAFIMKLKAGSGGIDTANNFGLAVRVKAGQRPDKAYKPVRVSENLYLLYGPSIDQVFRNIRSEVTPDADKYLQTEFERLIAFEMRS